MPTTVWMIDDVEDRRAEAGVYPWPAPATPRPRMCPFCGTTFVDRGQWQRHLDREHPLERPVLALLGREAPARLRVRTAIGPGELEALNCTAVKVARDGGAPHAVPVDGLGAELVARPRGHYVVHLENGRAQDSSNVRTEFVVSVDVVDQAVLDDVDRAFVRLLAVDRVDMGAVRHFADLADRRSEGAEYAGALAEYVIGVMGKDGLGDLPFAAYEGRFLQALAVLADYDRPIADAVAACVRLNLNDVRSLHRLSGDETVDACLEGLRTVALGSPLCPPPPERVGRKGPLCPIDRATHEILLTFRRLSGTIPEPGALEDAAARVVRGTLSPYDAVKLGVLAADAALREGRAEVAGEMLRVLVHDPVFGRWATAQLPLVEQK